MSISKWLDLWDSSGTKHYWSGNERMLKCFIYKWNNNSKCSLMWSSPLFKWNCTEQCTSNYWQMPATARYSLTWIRYSTLLEEYLIPLLTLLQLVNTMTSSCGQRLTGGRGIGWKMLINTKARNVLAVKYAYASWLQHVLCIGLARPLYASLGINAT